MQSKVTIETALVAARAAQAQETNLSFATAGRITALDLALKELRKSKGVRETAERNIRALWATAQAKALHRRASDNDRIWQRAAMRAYAEILQDKALIRASLDTI